MAEFLWPVVPICAAQQRDVRPEDLLADGLFRRCDTQRAGAGYNRFASIASRRLRWIPHAPTAEDLREQFIVQLRGCPLRCPYCYVTPTGVFGRPVEVGTSRMIESFKRSGALVFHLMGGAPGIYLRHWSELQAALPVDAVFHSDLLGIENEYDDSALREVARFPRHLIAINVKGTSAENFRANTGRAWNSGRFWRNMEKVAQEPGLNWYFTFTAPDPVELPFFLLEFERRLGQRALRDAYPIRVRQYKALDWNKE